MPGDAANYGLTAEMGADDTTQVAPHRAITLLAPSLASIVLSVAADGIAQTFAWKRCIEADMPQCSPAKCQVPSRGR